MQIDAIILYNSTGETRELKFNTGKVNIITGESKTGKTALIDIIDYCLGSEGCSIREGVVRQYVEWFAIRIKVNEEQIFIARQNPSKLGLQSTGNIFFANADTIATPAISEIINNSNIDYLKNTLSRKIGIGEYNSTPDEGSTRASLSVNFKHSRYYCFQPQYLIAQPDYLFYNQTEPFVPQSIKDTLPYFLGAVREDTIIIEQRISSLKRTLTSLIKTQTETLRIKQEGSRRILTMIEEAKQVNLLPVDLIIESNEVGITALNAVINWEVDAAEIVSSQNENLKNLLDEKNILVGQLTVINDELNSATAFLKEVNGYQSEAGQQAVRLQSIQLFNNEVQGVHNCPLCSSEIASEIPSIAAIRDSLQTLSNNLRTTQTETPRVTSYIENLRERKSNLAKDIDGKNASIRALYKELDDASKYQELSVRRGKVIGRASLLLESYEETAEDNTIQERIATLSQEMAELERLISRDEKEELLSAALNILNHQMTLWKDQLDLEYQEAPIRFDLKKLTLFADTNRGSIPLGLMGSGANWVGYHLLIHFALHKLFIKNNRPTPHFLVLDQPSQVYFPPEQDLENNGSLNQVVKSSDENAVNLMFKFMIDIVNELSPDLQVIITDHANIKTPEFQGAILEEWRNGQKLVPVSWID